MKIRNILATKGMNTISMRPEQTVKDAITLLTQYNIGAVVVLDADERLVGILSERDLIRAVASDNNVMVQPVSSVMTSNVITGTPQDDLQSVLQTMTNGRFRHLPIIDRGAMIGIVSIGDLVKSQLDEYKGEIDTLRTQLIEGEA
ncbi:MAG: CBS domain-containing protein [Herpetosiphonaceae bacterium]|nr:CBS domain-containing protein [Herpetosiphonaceae bacterium]